MPGTCSASPATDRAGETTQWKSRSSGAPCWPAPPPECSAFIFARIFVEPAIESAIGYEDGIGAAREALGGAVGWS